MNLRIIYLLIFAIPFQAHSFAFSDMVDQTVIGPLLKDVPKHSYTPALGINSRINGLTINNLESLTTTNKNSYLIGLDIDESNTTLTLPFKDPKESNDKRIDSKLLYINTSLKLNEHFQTELYYQYNKGYLKEEKDNELLTLFPDIGYERIAVSLYYLNNSDHRSFLFSPVLYKRPRYTKTSWSLIYALDVSQYKIFGLDNLSNYSQFDSPTDLQRTTIYNITAGISYSGSVFWDHWFIGGALGLYLGNDFIEKYYAKNVHASDTNFSSSSLFNFSFGYTWTSLSMGFYLENKSISSVFDKINISNSLGKVGWYTSYTF